MQRQGSWVDSHWHLKFGTAAPYQETQDNSPSLRTLPPAYTVPWSLSFPRADRRMVRCPSGVLNMALEARQAGSTWGAGCQAWGGLVAVRV